MDASRGFGAKAGAEAGTTPLPPPSYPTLPPTYATPPRPQAQILPRPDAPAKTPISLLQEACLRKATTPLYELISTEGQVHEPTFMYRVTVDKYMGNGSGKSKKTARHLAAKGVLQELIRDGVWAAWGLPGRSVAEALDYVDGLVAGLGKGEGRAEGRGGGGGSESGAGEEANPVGKLQERCNNLRWPLPEYELEETAGAPHQRSFAVSVRIGKLSSKAEANSKKAAKRQAAELMLTQIANLKGQEGFDEDDLVDVSLPQPTHHHHPHVRVRVLGRRR